MEPLLDVTSGFILNVKINEGEHCEGYYHESSS